MKKFYKQVVCLNEENLILKIWIFINRRWELLNTNVTNNTMMRVISNESFTRVLENNSRILVVLITINPLKMPNTGWRLVLEGDSIFGIFKLSFPFPFSLVRHRMELTINHFIQNISNSIERTHWILASVSPMTTTFLEKNKNQSIQYSEENFKIFQKFKF